MPSILSDGAPGRERNCPNAARQAETAQVSSYLTCRLISVARRNQSRPSRVLLFAHLPERLAAGW